MPQPQQGGTLDMATQNIAGQIEDADANVRHFQEQLEVARMIAQKAHATGDADDVEDADANVRHFERQLEAATSARTRIDG